ncbi:MAG: zinc ribbon domain-containing protein [Candidatus Eisenbacteria bacterium]|nr:zinc ribbon domain-containing protein [Candidatus Eisenbacteria bacterium]
MPIFEYQCDDCGHVFDALVWKDEEVRCEKCDGARVHRRITGFSVSGGGGRRSGGDGGCAPSGGG